MQVLTYISLVSPLLVIILGWKQRFTLLWLYAGAGLLLDNLSYILKQAEFNYRLTGNIFVLVELACITAFYSKNVFKGSGVFLVIMSLSGLLFLLHSGLTSFFQLHFQDVGLLCAVYIALGVFGYYKMLQFPATAYLNNSPFFWVNTAFFLYASTNCLLFLFATYLSKESFILMLSIWGFFFTTINILRYLFIGIGLYKTAKVEN